MTELAAKKNRLRNAETIHPWKSRRQLIFAIAMVFVSGKLLEYTYVRKFNSRSTMEQQTVQHDSHNSLRQKQHVYHDSTPTKNKKEGTADEYEASARTTTQVISTEKP